MLSKYSLRCLLGLLLLGGVSGIMATELVRNLPKQVQIAKVERIATLNRLCIIDSADISGNTYNLKIEIEADGGIRRETVPLLHAAGADFIVPGSLMFKEDPSAMRKWLASL